ncbi:hypothetical protein [Streptomyces mutomycini]
MHTAVRTVYRLSGVAPDVEAILSALDLALLDGLGAELHAPQC